MTCRIKIISCSFHDSCSEACGTKHQRNYWNDKNVRYIIFVYWLFTSFAFLCLGRGEQLKKQERSCCVFGSIPNGMPWKDLLWLIEISRIESICWRKSKQIEREFRKVSTNSIHLFWFHRHIPRHHQRFGVMMNVVTWTTCERRSVYVRLMPKVSGFVSIN